MSNDNKKKYDTRRDDSCDSLSFLGGGGTPWKVADVNTGKEVTAYGDTADEAEAAADRGETYESQFESSDD